MNEIKVPEPIKFVMECYYRFGLWSHRDVATVKETRIKLFYSVYYLLFVLSAVIGAFNSEDEDESILLIQLGIVLSVLSAKLLSVIWRKNEIVNLVNQVGVYCLSNEEQRIRVNGALHRFNRIITIYFIQIIIAVTFVGLILPFLGSEKKLFYDIAFPVDWSSSDIAFWLAFAFVVGGIFISLMGVLFSILMWYLMLTCALRYEVLGIQIKAMGTKPNDQLKLYKIDKQNLFLNELFEVVELHQLTKKSTGQTNSFFSVIFTLQLTTSGLGICFSIYSVAFHSSENVMEYLIHAMSLCYNIVDILIILYLSNEIKLRSNRLSYCLFESNWTNQPQSTKQCITVFGELLQRPFVLVILKIYSLTLDTFIAIIKSAYNMFNILQNLK